MYYYGVQVAAYSYNEWGKVLGVTGSKAEGIGQLNPIRYRGYYYDVETGFYLTGTRYYDPEIGRLISADKAIAGVGGTVNGYNLYSYCFNNPVNMSDPTGDWPKWIETAANWVNKNIIQPVANFFSPSVGIQYKNGAGLAEKAKAAVLSGRATVELELFGWQIEFGVSGDLFSVGAEAMIGVFPDDSIVYNEMQASPFGDKRHMVRIFFLNRDKSTCIIEESQFLNCDSSIIQNEMYLLKLYVLYRLYPQ